MCEKGSEVGINRAAVRRKSLVAKGLYIQNRRLYQSTIFFSQVFPIISCARTSNIVLLSKPLVSPIPFPYSYLLGPSQGYTYGSVTCLRRFASLIASRHLWIGLCGPDITFAETV